MTEMNQAELNGNILTIDQKTYLLDKVVGMRNDLKNNILEKKKIIKYHETLIEDLNDQIAQVEENLLKIEDQVETAEKDLRGDVEMTQEQLNAHLFDAVREGNLEAVKQAIEDGADVNDRTDYQSTPLHFAARWGRTEIAKLLLEHNVKINATDEDGCTPLDEAAEKGHIKTAELLKQQGAC